MISMCSFKNLLKFHRTKYTNNLRYYTMSRHRPIVKYINKQCVSVGQGLFGKTRLNYLKNSNLIFRSLTTKEGYKSNNVKKLLDDATTLEQEDNWTPNGEWATSPYPKGTVNRRLQSSKSFRPKIDPRHTSLILFPGEGSQFVGMGVNLLSFPGVKDIFAAANEILRYDLLSLCLKGPKSKLDEPKYAQVAVMVSSLAALEKLKEERPASVESCFATGGFGVGEITALTFAGVLSFERAVHLVQLRAEAMETASEMEPGGMLMVMYNPTTKVHEVLIKAKDYAVRQGVEKPVCEVAQYLFPHCKVIAGHTECLDYIAKHYQQLKLNKVRRLNVGGAYYTSLMQPAMIPFKKYLEKCNLQDPAIAVHSTTDGKVYFNKEDVIKKLPKQMVKPIKWEQMMHIMYERPVGLHFPSTFEVGPGNSLRQLLKMVNAKAYDCCYNVFDQPTV